ncbi:TRNA wybutosine-synthesizing protein like [Senna tora]|uniref:tRNA wybutosine-synthesizing protein like n=1 Tax=Senna tora TaxID=362788 RepID=A0A834X2V2_9FABA|nr:TRNA wybutosine-synthesizing protein like [Senna tora]
MASSSFPNSDESTNTILLMTLLMEETQEDHHHDDEAYDHRLVSMIQSLEAEITRSHQYDDDEEGQVDALDCSTSAVSSGDDQDYYCDFDEMMMMDAWSPCAAAGEDSDDDYSHQFYYGLLLDQQPNYHVEFDVIHRTIPPWCNKMDAIISKISCDDEIKEMEFLDIDDALLMSLMEESPCDQERYEDDDGDRLDSIIRSLEAEINANAMNDLDSRSVNSESINNTEDVTRMWDMGQMDGQDYWNPCDFEMGWAEMDAMPSSLSDHGSWCINPYEDEMEGITEIFDVSSNFNNGYNHQFWQESYNSVICD